MERDSNSNSTSASDSGPIWRENRILDLEGAIADARETLKEKNWHIKSNNLRSGLKAMRKELDNLIQTQTQEQDTKGAD